MPRLMFFAALLVLPLGLTAQEAATTAPPAEEEAEANPMPEPAMTLDRLDAIIRALDPEAQDNGAAWQFTIDGVQVLIITDARADRMRAITPIASSDELMPEQMTRMMQANFDSALDARYAIANGLVWSAFIHPLGALEKNQLISGIGQVVNLARSFGTLYSSGGLQFGGGDSGALQRALIEELLKKGEEI